MAEKPKKYQVLVLIECGDEDDYELGEMRELVDETVELAVFNNETDAIDFVEEVEKKFCKASKIIP